MPWTVEQIRTIVEARRRELDNREATQLCDWMEVNCPASMLARCPIRPVAERWHQILKNAEEANRRRLKFYIEDKLNYLSQQTCEFEKFTNLDFGDGKTLQ